MKEHPGNYGPVSLISILGKVMEQIILETISKHTQGRQVIGSNQNVFMKGKLCLMNLIAVCNTMASLVERGESYGYYVYFSKASHAVSRNKSVKYRLDKWSVW